VAAQYTEIVPQVLMASRVCAYSQNNVASANLGAVTYNWTITNGTITGGQGTSNVTYTAGASGVVTLQVAAIGTDSCGNFNASKSATIDAGPTVTIPAAIAGCVGSQVTIPVTLTGTAPFTIVWSDGVTQTNVTSTRTSRTITVTGTRNLRITSVSDASCNTSNAATIHVVANSAPSIVEEPQDVDVTRGQTAHLVVVASGDVQYQWFEGTVGDESHPVGDNLAEFTTPALDKKTEYWVKVSNSCGSLSSRQVTVRVLGSSRRRSVQH
jgi:hypothetical protein